jgi:hypothetical protein
MAEASCEAREFVRILISTQSPASFVGGKLFAGTHLVDVSMR